MIFPAANFELLVDGMQNFQHEIQQDMAKFKIGVLGCGMIAELGHLPAITQCPDLELYALSDLDWQRTLELQKRFGARHAFPTEEAFWKAGFDAVVICTPARLHREHVLAAAEHGKHVLCEKPLAKSVADIEVMRDRMQAAGLLLATGTLGDMPSANDALMATKISEEATRQAIRDRARFSSDCHSTMQKSVPQPAELTHVPLDASEYPETF